ncbi:acyl-CoA dehydrogenase family protein [Pedobacter jejuensis]|uniref:Acyl-CoA dehydrogenase n=1 Tax=Pedobacter jejuensis TaxID=1268550 RepID=A0A3N0C0G4_9SPHI|nr:acyl-CoA dehydrogenase family protein [Pedobacter jejuensis]RNL55750.1 acyl-CoA dehydrogenase [Pedobacter jejuensis]
MIDTIKEAFNPITFQNALAEIEQMASVSEHHTDGLSKEFELLREISVLKIVLPGEYLDFNKPNTPALLTLLKDVGKANLSVGRIFEGHINTLYLIHLYADEDQKRNWFEGVKEYGHLFGVWNTQAQNGIEFKSIDNKLIVSGNKTFCSGVGLVNRALITGNINHGERAGWQMSIVNMGKISDDKVNKEIWKPLGMKASGSYTVDFSGYELADSELLSKPGIYLKQPYFSAGAIRFAAVHLGGAEAVAHNTIKYLKELNRTEDPIQRMRIASIMTQLVAGQLWLEKAGENYDNWLENKEFEQNLIAFANMTRTTIEDICLRIMDESNKCVGARGLMAPYTLERIFRDLTFYLRQPAPDATRLNIADFFINKNSVSYGTNI